MTVINLTPHSITVMDDDGFVVRTYPASGSVARVTVEAREWGHIDGIPVVTNVYGAVENLPIGDGEEVYLVSLMVLAACEGRRDVFAPDTGPGSVVRNEAGQIIGVKRFVAASS